ncbi:hypothetical protein Sps_00314 [Shewanella psychrophila]|uniref:Uncharacterized protein n=1 Tax=Shewanella psychrophila TaxID=225848 RepID=A0A1S6HJ64_9GAMM|nr:hypothetical protein [Shewanella psychrophila]AQS35534.1 hypothetical protein Sps_00314 [Shewanella psychrophila]
MISNRSDRFSQKSCVIGVACIFLSTFSTASDTQKSLTQKADAAREESRELEQEQLQKARDAAGETQAREKKIYKKTQPNDWEAEQRVKAQEQFNERESREDKYLREAREAVLKERKIPKPF